MPPLPPIKPKTSSRGGQRPGAKGSPKSKAPPGPPAIPTLTPAKALVINGDEATQREAIEHSQMIAYTAMTLCRNDEAVLGIQIETEKTRNLLSSLGAVTREHSLNTERSSNTLAITVSATQDLHKSLATFIELQGSQQSSRLAFLEKHAHSLEAQVALLQRENEALRADNLGLKYTLTQKLVHTNVEFEQLRSHVRDSLAADQMEYSVIRSGLHQRIDAAVLQYHKPQFDSALQALKEHAEATLLAVQQHTARLHFLVDSVGSAGSVVEAKSMHSQIPESYRAELRCFSKEQLLSLVDILSFEPNVVSSVATAVAAATHRNTQTVF